MSAPDRLRLLGDAERLGWPRESLPPGHRQRIGEAAWRQAITLATDAEVARLVAALRRRLEAGEALEAAAAATGRGDEDGGGPGGARWRDARS